MRNSIIWSLPAYLYDQGVYAKTVCRNNNNNNNNTVSVFYETFISNNIRDYCGVVADYNVCIVCVCIFHASSNPSNNWVFASLRTNHIWNFIRVSTTDKTQTRRIVIYTAVALAGCTSRYVFWGLGFETLWASSGSRTDPARTLYIFTLQFNFKTNSFIRYNILYY